MVSEHLGVWIVPARHSRSNDPTGARNIPATLTAISNPKDYYNKMYAAITSVATEMKSPCKYKPNSCLTTNDTSQHTLVSTPKFGQNTKAWFSYFCWK